MLDTSHIEGGGEELRQALAKKPVKSHEETTQEALAFYLKEPAYKEVYVVSCDKCGHDMCIEVLEPSSVNQFKSTHHQGRRRVTLGDAEYPGGRLLSHRKRLDGVMGYRCVCGNNTILSNPERGLIPQTNDPNLIPYLPSIEPHQEAELRFKMATGGYKPDVEELGNKTRIESFTVERLK